MSRKMLIDGEVDQTAEEGVHYDFDLFVIGAGSGGVRAARFSANYGAKVEIIHEQDFLITSGLFYSLIHYSFF